MRTYLILIFTACFFSMIGQVYLQRDLSSPGIWAYAHGWQNEIASWNACLCTVILLFIRFRANVLKRLIFSIVVLTALLGVNHLTSVILEDVPAWHIGLAVLNLFGAGLGVIVLTIEHRMAITLLRQYSARR